MPPDDVGSRDVDSVEFAVNAATSIVAFTAVQGSRQDDDRDLDQRDTPDGETVVLRMSLRLRYEPPLMTFRFNINVFGQGDVKTALYFDIPRHHISSLYQKTFADAHEIPELRPDDVRCLSGGAMRLCIILDRPGRLVMPREAVSVKGRSQSTLQTLESLATALDLTVFIPRKTLSETQIRCIQQTIASPASAQDQEQQAKEHRHWLAGLYGGVSGRIWGNDDDSAAANAAATVDDASTPSESGESTVATATPPAYRKLAGTYSQDAAATAADTSLPKLASPEPNRTATASPPPYIRPKSEDEAVVDIMGKGLGKRLHDDDHDDRHGDGDTRHSRRRVGSPPASTSAALPGKQDMGTQPKQAADLVLAKLDQILVSCQSLERRFQHLERSVEVLTAEVVTMQRTQKEIQAVLEDKTAENERRIDQLESEALELSERCDDLDDTHAETMETLENMGDKCDSIELEIEAQVYEMVKARLTAALETM